MLSHSPVAVILPGLILPPPSLVSELPWGLWTCYRLSTAEEMPSAAPLVWEIWPGQGVSSWGVLTSPTSPLSMTLLQTSCTHLCGKTGFRYYGFSLNISFQRIVETLFCVWLITYPISDLLLSCSNPLDLFSFCTLRMSNSGHMANCAVHRHSYDLMWFFLQWVISSWRCLMLALLPASSLAYFLPELSRQGRSGRAVVDSLAASSLFFFFAVLQWVHP